MRGLRALGSLVATAVVGAGLVMTPAVAAAQSPSSSGDLPAASSTPYVPPKRVAAESDKDDPAWVNPKTTLPPVKTVEVDVPASGWAQAGDLPVSVARPSAGAAPARVRVRMLSQEETAAAGGRLLGVEVSRADGGAAPAALGVTIDYSGVAKAFGGDFAARLVVLRGVECVADTPCLRRRIAARNVATAGKLVALAAPVRPDPAAAASSGETLATAPEPDSGFGPQSVDGDEAPLTEPSLTEGTTLVASTSSSSSNGDYGASTVTASSRWSVGVGSGAFTYSYPIGVPPAPAGAAPALSLDYSSQAVDGRNLAENGQASKVGEGWSFEPGFIERKFPTCGGSSAAKSEKCWSPNNEYFLHFGGRSGEIVRTSASSNEWRLRGNDPGLRILSYTGADNGDDHNVVGDKNGEYFLVITPDGTKYWFGLGTEPSNTPTAYTDSAWTVPVVGGSGEPCYTAPLATSWCHQAYRWNVDRVLDLNGNVTSFFYTKETNRYARQATSALTTEYVRSGYLSRVEYGQRSGFEGNTARARVLVTTLGRCTEQPCAALTPGNQSSWPDVPLDLMCTTTTCPATLDSPTFWSTRKIREIRTEYYAAEWSPPAYTPVAAYFLDYSFPATGDTTSPSLWLTTILRRGLWGSATPIDVPPVRMDGVLLPNRVNTGAGVPPLNKWRVSGVRNELNGMIEVTYGKPHPCPENTPIDSANNATDCYPLWYDDDPQNSEPGGWVPFYKYLVTQTVTKDDATYEGTAAGTSATTGGTPDATTTYEYLDTPAWHYDDSLLNIDNETWSDYRGHSDVRVITTGSGTSADRHSRYTVFRGMHGDKLTATTSKTVSLTDSTGSTFTDHSYLAGLTLETKRFFGGVHMASSLNRYWAYRTIAGPVGYQPHDAHYVRTSRTLDRALNMTTNAWRTHRRDMTYSQVTAALLDTSDEGNTSVSGDETCTAHGYTYNTADGSATAATWIVDRSFRTVTYSQSCTNTTGRATLAKAEYLYDNQALAATPTKGNLTETIAYADAGTTSRTKTGYDALGRVTSVMRPREAAKITGGVAATTTYLPSTGYPYNGIKTTDETGHATTVVPYAALGVPYQVVDNANNDTTTITVDPLGRTTEVLKPKVGEVATEPTLKFSYVLNNAWPNKVLTERLLTTGSYVKSATYLDGFGRVAQTQEMDPGGDATDRRLTVTRYDTLGQVAAQSETFSDTADGVGGSLASVSLAEILREQRYAIDGLGRVTRTAHYANAARTRYSDVTYNGWDRTVHGSRTDTDGPKLNDVVYQTDVLGRTTKVVNYNDAESAINTTYQYTLLGDLATITDKNNNVTTYGYDWLRRRTSSTDRDQGSWSTSYDRDGNVEKVTDAKQQTVQHTYDVLGRKTQTSTSATGGATPVLRAAWEYAPATNPPATDVTANRVGRLVSAKSYTAVGALHELVVDGYDDRGRLTGKTWKIAGDTPGSLRDSLAGDYAFGYAYNESDLVTSVTMPAISGVTALSAAETVTTTFNTAGLPTTLTGAGAYVGSTAYYNNGQVQSRLLGAGSVKRDYTYDTASGRVATITAGTPAGATTSATYEQTSFTYDADQNVTSVTEATTGIAQRECFFHDKLNRLTRAYTAAATTTCTPNGKTDNAEPAPYDHTYAYNDLGDITSITAVDGSTSTTTNYLYAEDSSVHAASKVYSGDAPTSATHIYDANGATTTRNTRADDHTGTYAQTLTWSPLHLLESVSAADGTSETSFAYDADGNRLIRSTSTAATLYLDGMEITADEITNGTATSIQKRGARYYGSHAMRTAIGTATTATLTTLLRNHQNSASTQITAGTVTRQRYTPYGARRGTERFTGTDRGFLDKTEDPTGLVQMGARYYDPGIGRFVSVDPLSIPEQPQSLAAYSYSGNNPTTFSDPTGLMREDPIETDLGGGSSDGDGVATTTQTPTPTPTPTPSGGSGSAGGSDGDHRVLVWGGRVWGAAKAVSTFANPLSKPLYDHTEGCFNQDKSSCGWLWVDLVTLALPFAGAGRGASTATAASGLGDDVLRAANTADEAGALVRYDPRAASRNLVGQVGEGYAVTPGGRSISAHAAERIALGGPGRSPTTLARVDDILNNPTSLKYDPVRDTVKVMQGKDFVVVSGTGPQHVVTVMVR